MKVPLKIRPSEVEEKTSKTIPREFVEDLAALKGRDILEKELSEGTNPFIVASDTIVAIDGKILEKPKSREHAREMLLSLSGKEHEVYTAVFMATGKQERCFSMCSKVTFSEISAEILDLYLSGDEALDKAGAYGIQGQGLLFVSKLNGSYSNVVGFPLSDFLIQMKAFLCDLGFDGNKWRDLFEL